MLFSRSRLLALLTLLVGVAACSNTAERLSSVGQPPDLTPIENPAEHPAYRPVSLPMPAERAQVFQANSLWRQGSRAFFNDQRARRVGDILTVRVTIADQARLENETSRSRANEEGFGMGGFFGLENQLDDFLPGEVDNENLVDLDSNTSNSGRGNVERNEDIKINVAAVIVQVLPNGNLVLQGRQEVRVNFEVRELYVAGVARPEDIKPDNTIPHDEIAELRVAYGGRGQITDVQQPRYGAQVLDIVLPF